MKRSRYCLVFYVTLSLLVFSCDPVDTDERSLSKDKGGSDTTTTSSNPTGEVLAQYTASNFTASVQKLSSGGDGILVDLPDPKGEADYFIVKIKDEKGTILKEIQTCSRNELILCMKEGKLKISVNAVNSAGTYEGSIEKEVTCSDLPTDDMLKEIEGIFDDMTAMTKSALATASALKKASLDYYDNYCKSNSTSSTCKSSTSSSTSTSSETKTTFADVAKTIGNSDNCTIKKTASALEDMLRSAEEAANGDVESETAIAIAVIGIAGALALGTVAIYKGVIEKRQKKDASELKNLEDKIMGHLEGGRKAEAKKVLQAEILRNNFQFVRLAGASARVKKMKEPQLKFKGSVKKVILDSKVDYDGTPYIGSALDSNTPGKSLNILLAGTKIKGEAGFKAFLKKYKTELKDIFEIEVDGLDSTKFYNDVQSDFRQDLEVFEKKMKERLDSGDLDKATAAKIKSQLGIESSADIKARSNAKFRLLGYKLIKHKSDQARKKAQGELKKAEAVKSKVRTEMQELVKNEEALKKLDDLMKKTDLDMDEFKTALLDVFPKGGALHSALSKADFSGKSADLRAMFASYTSKAGSYAKLSAEVSRLKQAGEMIPKVVDLLGKGAKNVDTIAKSAKTLTLSSSTDSLTPTTSGDYEKTTLEAFSEIIEAEAARVQLNADLITKLLANDL